MRVFCRQAITGKNAKVAKLAKKTRRFLRAKSFVQFLCAFAPLPLCVENLYACWRYLQIAQIHWLLAKFKKTHGIYYVNRRKIFQRKEAKAQRRKDLIVYDGYYQ